MARKILLLAIGAFVLMVACLETGRPGLAFPPERAGEEDVMARASSGLPFGMRFPPLERMCEYDVAVLWRSELLDSRRFDPTMLDEARRCGTKVVVRLHGATRHIVNDNGVGLNLLRYEERIRVFAGLIDPYVADGTIAVHLTIDEPHDCKNDWGGVCPSPAEVEEAARISKKYWPDLPTQMHTLPRYALQYQWVHTDSINFQYAFHKGDLDKFIRGGLEVLEGGYARDISWSIQAISGGCADSRECAMTPEQVEQVARAMCATGRGLWVTFSSYRPELMTREMEAAIGRARAFCRAT